MFVPPPKPAKVARQTEDQDEAEADEAEKKRIAERGAKFEDIKGNCRDCGEEFVWSAGEQGFYEDKGFTDGLKSCLPCRRKAKKLGERPDRSPKSGNPKPSSGWGNSAPNKSSSGWGSSSK